ncbi:type I restriction endonuclease subunit R [Dubosiella newyorkensis]|uniref:Type I restriction enzyme endonuclease subunit n=1 Tax=Dubosiella newyorkensis TaxID=1862672 RepID=A0A1U7NM31_9FIRM|nr:HsdR family type I site-specific deoxyribonuclease [Dubosiella newyorkensis]OLU46188.1 DEAD/DEAH box helicase [Dubosiella newyorkensis]
MIETENQFEKNLIEKLCNSPLSTKEDLKDEFHILKTRNWVYEPKIKTTNQLWDNFKKILERLNQDTLERPLSENEFAQVKRVINELTTPFKAGQFLYGLNGVSQVEVDLDDGRHVFLTVFDQSQIGAGNTVYQVVNQIERPAVIPGKKNRRFDVTLLINGLPIIQIELKKASHDIKEGLNQMQQYADENQFRDIFSTLQILIAMSPNNARYMANTTAERFNTAFAFHWQRRSDNKIIRDWREFTDSFLSIPMAHNMATNYMILDGTQNKETLKVMRPYQVVATEKVINAVKGYDFDYGSGKLGYVWHTTGSGKTITSFKTAWLASKLPNVDKVIFLVDRKALTSQTLENYRAYDPESKEEVTSIQNTKNTSELSHKLKEKNNDIIITSVQKLERLVSRKNFKAPDRNFLFIVDEAHRSTGGGAFEKVQKAFKKSAFIGYTGTPMFDHTNSRYSTKHIFGSLLHAYTIRDAIADKNVLGFKVDFLTTISEKAMKEQYLPAFFRNEHPDWTEEQINEKINNMTEYDMDDKVSKSFYDNNYAHVKEVVRDIMSNWRNRSVDGKYNALLTTRVGGGGASTPMAMMYFREFLRAQKEEPYAYPLKVAVTFSQDASNGDSMLETNKGLDEAIDEYNKQFDTSFDSSTAAEYREDLESRLKKTNSDGKFLDLVIVVDQLLTGFDAPQLNSLYVDRTLRDADLVQAYSRTNRIEDPVDKPYGHVVNYRWPRENEKLMKEALAVYTNKENANKSTGEQGKLLEDDGVLAGDFEKVLKKVQDEIKDIRKMTDNFNEIPPSEKEDEQLLSKLRKYYQGLAKLKQFPPRDDSSDGNKDPESGFDYDNPDALIVKIGMTPEENQRLNTVVVNELKEKIAKKKKISPILIDLKVEYLKDVLVNYDYLTKLLEDLLNQVHEDKKELVAETEKEIYKFANGLEDRTYAKEIFETTRAIKNKDFPPSGSSLKYPFKLTSSYDVIKEAKNDNLQRKLLRFRNKWGITDVVSSQELLNMINNHKYNEKDLDDANQLTNILKEGASTYKELSLDPEIQKMSKIKYRNSLRTAIYELADQMKHPE